MLGDGRGGDGARRVGRRAAQTRADEDDYTVLRPRAVRGEVVHVQADGGEKFGDRPRLEAHRGGAGGGDAVGILRGGRVDPASCVVFVVVVVDDDAHGASGECARVRAAAHSTRVADPSVAAKTRRGVVVAHECCSASSKSCVSGAATDDGADDDVAMCSTHETRKSATFSPLGSALTTADLTSAYLSRPRTRP